MQADYPRLLLIVFGPPGSGKTTTARHILSLAPHPQGKDALLVSADSLEQYLRSHTREQLLTQLTSREGWESVGGFSLDRSAFVEHNWKQSRMLIREQLGEWLQQYGVVVVEDEMLLRSQRKALRHVAETTAAHYLEIEMDCSLQQCLENASKRSGSPLPPQVIVDSFKKFERQEHAYLLQLSYGECIKWEDILTRAMPVKIQHPELHQKQQATAENAARDSEEVKIRKFVSQIITDPALAQQFFPLLPPKQIPNRLSALKKQYRPKERTLAGFVAFLRQADGET